MKPERDPDQPDLAALAKRFMDLWQEQTSALAADPELAESIGRFLAALPPGMPFWPGLGSGAGKTSAPGRTPSAAAPSDGGGRGLDELASRLRHVEERLARLEAGTGRKRPGTANKPKKRRA